MRRLRVAGVLVLATCGTWGCASDSDTQQDAAGGAHNDGSSGAPNDAASGTHNDAAVGHDAAVMHDAAAVHPDSGSQHDATTGLDAGADAGGSAGANGDAGPDAMHDAAAPTGPFVVYVGSYGSQIDIFVMDPDTLALTPAGNATTAAGPSFLAIDPVHRLLVAADESAGMVESFTIAPDTGALTRVDGESSGGAGPAHVSFDQSGDWVLVANYGSGTAAVLRIENDGSLSSATSTVSPGMNAHQIVTTAANVAYVPCLGSDYIALYDFGPFFGTLNPRTPVPTADGAGPRHIVFSPDGTHAWLMNEKNSTVTSFSVAGGGSLTAGTTVSSLPQDFTGANTGAEIAVHPSGKWVYSSNRGHDSIAVFEVGQNGALTLIANTPTGGADPRHFSLVPGVEAMLVANMSSDSIYGFRIDPDTGLLTSAGELTTVDTVSFVTAVQLP